MYVRFVFLSCAHFFCYVISRLVASARAASFGPPPLSPVVGSFFPRARVSVYLHLRAAVVLFVLLRIFVFCNVFAGREEVSWYQV